MNPAASDAAAAPPAPGITRPRVAECVALVSLAAAVAYFLVRLVQVSRAAPGVVSYDEDRTGAIEGERMRPVAAMLDVRVYENPSALPRAAFVPRVEVVPDAAAVLQRLATGDDDLRSVALVEEPASGFLGDATGTEGSVVEFELDEPEHLVLRVHAPRRGFLFLADQYFPGWRATIDGAATPIARANYAFRIVEVPAGDSVVDFRYRPRSVVVGALVSASTLPGVVALLRGSRRG